MLSEMRLIHMVDYGRASRESFENAILIWIKKPHVADRRLCGADIILEATISYKQIAGDSLLEILACHIDSSISQRDFLLNLMTKKVSLIIENVTGSVVDTFSVYLRHLVAKSAAVKGAYELVFKDNTSLCTYFVMLCEDDDQIKSLNFDHVAYKIGFNTVDKKIELYSTCTTPTVTTDSTLPSDDLQNVVHHYIDKDNENFNIKRATHSLFIFPSTTWLSETLIRKICSWSQEEMLNTDVKSLRLLNVSQYNKKYNQLKDKYGRHLVKMWTENTDPLKYVYEDIGIAAYLLVLWESMDNGSNDDDNDTITNKYKSKIFVDLGCGNGLLVYLLNSEGHRGYGVDIRSRKIWESLRPTADLREFAVLPSDENQFPDADWLIGNHSDELTPWIPVMAAQCQNSDCKYFVLPCCPWDFTSKFHSIGKNGTNCSGQRSKYGEYLDFIGHVGEVCGFRVQRDTLRIPSTRRVCFVGYKDDTDQNCDRLQAIKNFIESRSSTRPPNGCLVEVDGRDNHTNIEVGDDASCRQRRVDFRPRCTVEVIRNTSNLNREFLDGIRHRVMNRLLEEEDNFVDIHDLLVDGTFGKWNKGGSVALPDICDMFHEQDLKMLKSSCGGLQTVLKNCSDVFCVRGGRVALRDWMSQEFKDFILYRESKRPTKKATSTDKIKTKECFYHSHHPDGCPLTKESCKFAHGMEDKRAGD